MTKNKNGFQFAFVTLTKHTDQKQEGKGGRKDLFQLTNHSPSLKGAKTEAQGREAGTEAGNMEEPCLQAGFPPLPRLFSLTSWPSWYPQLAYLYNSESPSQGCYHLHWTRPYHINRYKRKYNLSRENGVV